MSSRRLYSICHNNGSRIMSLSCISTVLSPHVLEPLRIVCQSTARVCFCPSSPSDDRILLLSLVSSSRHIGSSCSAAEVPYRPGSSLSRLDLHQNMPTKPMLRALVPLQRSLFSSSIRHDVNDVKWNERCDSTTSGKFARV